MKKDCIFIDKCTAPFCPLESKKNWKNFIWYPDEEICNSPNYVKKIWIRNQRKYSHRSAGGYYNFEMLKHNCVIPKGTKGIDPDKEEKTQLQKWFQCNPIKPEKENSGSNPKFKRID